MKGIKRLGVLIGTKWANIYFILLIHPYNINDTHKGAAKVNERIRWLVLVKIYGKRPKKLLNMIKIKIEIKIKVLPSDLLISILNSWCRVILIFKVRAMNRLLISHNILGKIKNRIPVLIQLLKVR